MADRRTLGEKLWTPLGLSLGPQRRPQPLPGAAGETSCRDVLALEPGERSCECGLRASTRTCSARSLSRATIGRPRCPVPRVRRILIWFLSLAAFRVRDKDEAACTPVTTGTARAVLDQRAHAAAAFATEGVRRYLFCDCSRGCLSSARASASGPKVSQLLRVDHRIVMRTSPCARIG